jgi:hypothetical protein
MSHVPLVGLRGGGNVPRTCPTCRGLLTDKLVGWGCGERLCRRCGNPTGSEFIETCWPRSYWEDAGREAEREHGSKATASS